jgi:hypothetical protein
MGKRRMTSETLRHSPDLAKSNARSIADPLVIIIASYRRRMPDANCRLSSHCGRRIIS